jgi:NAD-dependent deacetylase
MIAPDLPTGINMLGDMIASAQRIVPFTGAGISTEAGIPDFRSPGGLWTKNRPIPFDEFVASQDSRDEAWRRRLAMESYFAAAKPTRAHLAITTLYRAGKIPGLITQNVDDLHRQSGVSSEDIVELHGNTRYAHCLDCATRYEIAWVADRIGEANGTAPACACGGAIKTATISFGEAMPARAMQRASELVSSCDLLLVIGSSLVVWPAAGFPLMAKQKGARLVIINREPTEQDEFADLVVHEDIGETFAPFIRN